MERNEGEEGEREAVRKRMERKGEKGSEEDDYFNKFPPTMPSVVVLKFQSSLQVIMVFMPIGNSKWSTAKVKIALKTYELHFRNLIENHIYGLEVRPT
jgi:hypothetical protein